MAWRGSTSPTDRIFASLVYLLPLFDVIGLVSGVVGSGSFLSPIFRAIVIPLSPLLGLYYGFGGFMPLIIFFALFLLVVRNESIAHFIRFNAMQSILFGIVLSLISILWRYILAGALQGTLLEQTLFNTIFLGVVAAVGYSVVQSALGRYAEIPTISDAAYAQVR
ncbi:MAG: Tic20 family protein [Leptolyngbya sp. BL-A-14]